MKGGGTKQILIVAGALYLALLVGVGVGYANSRLISSGLHSLALMLNPKPMSRWYWRAPAAKAEEVALQAAASGEERFTLVTTAEAQEARLIDGTGEILHRWAAGYGEIWPDGRGHETEGPGTLHWDFVHLFPDGSLLVLFVGENTTPSNLGIAKLDRDSNVLWAHEANYHHTALLDDAGHILTLGSRIRDQKIAGAPHLSTPILEDYVAILSPQGELIREISVTDAFERSEWRSALHEMPDRLDGDFLHLNDIEIVPKDFQRRGSPFRPGDLILSARNPSMLLALDPESGDVTWATRGPWLMQHDPDLLDNGNLLLFDNLGHFGPGGRSRVIELDPESLEIVWSYGARDGEWLESEIRGAAQALENGRVLISESLGGRVLEVNRQGQLLWQHVTPARAGDGTLLPSLMHGIRRISREELSGWLPLDDSNTENEAFAGHGTQG